MKITLLILLLLSSAWCVAQDIIQKDKTNQMSPSEIRKSFPYNKTNTIKLVSFKYEYPQVDTTETKRPAYEPEIPKSNGQIDMTRMFEVSTLDVELEESLLNILVNPVHQDTIEVAFCYEPRNGIVFFDKKQRILGYIEICFECLQYKTDPDDITISTLFPDEFKALKSLFRKAGISYGTTEE